MQVEELSSGVSIRVGRFSAHREPTISTYDYVGEVFTSIECQAADWLVAWAALTQGEPGARAYPSRWITATADEGGITAGSPRPPTSLEEEVAKTDKAVAQLSLRHNSRLRYAIELEFEKRLPEREMAKLLHCNRNEARRLVSRACRAIYRIRAAL